MRKSHVPEPTLAHVAGHIATSSKVSVPLFPRATSSLPESVLNNREVFATVFHVSKVSTERQKVGSNPESLTSGTFFKRKFFLIIIIISIILFVLKIKILKILMKMKMTMKKIYKKILQI